MLEGVKGVSELFNLYRMFYKQEKNLSLAAKKIRYAIKITPKEDTSTLAGYMDTHAEVLWKLGNLDWAIIEIDKCIALEPENQYFKDQKEKFLEK